LEKVNVGTWTYAPAYWEDVEWGVKAQRMGFENLFIPTAHAHHGHQVTMKKVFGSKYIKALLNRNKYNFILRNHLEDLFGISLYKLLFLNTKFYTYNLNIKVLVFKLISSIRARAFASASPMQHIDLSSDISTFYLKPPIKGDRRPWILFVCPFSILPGSHGSAVRIRNLVDNLKSEYRIVLLSDEGWDYEHAALVQLTGIEVVSLIPKGRKEGNALDRIARIKSHSHDRLKSELSRLIALFRPRLVQIEHEELLGLVDIKTDSLPWVAGLHDVNTSDNDAENTYVDNLLEKYDGVISCSKEDFKLLKGCNKTLIENGIKPSQNSKYRPSFGLVLLMVVPFRYQPNLTATLKFISTCFTPLRKTFPNLELVILGGNSGPEIAHENPLFQQDGITVFGSTDKVREYLDVCTMTINPLTDVRGSCIKTIESLAAGRICISTVDAARGISHYDFQSLVIESSLKGFIPKIESLLNNSSLRHALEKPDSKLLEQFSWEKKAAMQHQFYKKFINEH